MPGKDDDVVLLPKDDVAPGSRVVKGLAGKKVSSRSKGKKKFYRDSKSTVIRGSHNSDSSQSRTEVERFTIDSERASLIKTERASFRASLLSTETEINSYFDFRHLKVLTQNYNLSVKGSEARDLGHKAMIESIKESFLNPEFRQTLLTDVPLTLSLEEQLSYFFKNINITDKKSFFEDTFQKLIEYFNTVPTPPEITPKIIESVIVFFLSLEKKPEESKEYFPLGIFGLLKKYIPDFLNESFIEPDSIKILLDLFIKSSASTEKDKNIEYFIEFFNEINKDAHHTDYFQKYIVDFIKISAQKEQLFPRFYYEANDLDLKDCLKETSLENFWKYFEENKLFKIENAEENIKIAGLQDALKGYIRTKIEALKVELISKEINEISDDKDNFFYQSPLASQEIISLVIEEAPEISFLYFLKAKEVGTILDLKNFKDAIVKLFSFGAEQESNEKMIYFKELIKAAIDVYKGDSLLQYIAQNFQELGNKEIILSKILDVPEFKKELQTFFLEEFSNNLSAIQANKTSEGIQHVKSKKPDTFFYQSPLVCQEIISLVIKEAPEISFLYFLRAQQPIVIADFNQAVHKLLESTGLSVEDKNEYLKELIRAGVKRYSGLELSLWIQGFVESSFSEPLIACNEQFIIKKVIIETIAKNPIKFVDFLCVTSDDFIEKSSAILSDLLDLLKNSLDVASTVQILKNININIKDNSDKIQQSTIDIIVKILVDKIIYTEMIKSEMRPEIVKFLKSEEFIDIIPSILEKCIKGDNLLEGIAVLEKIIESLKMLQKKALREKDVSKLEHIENLMEESLQIFFYIKSKKGDFIPIESVANARERKNKKSKASSETRSITEESVSSFAAISPTLQHFVDDFLDVNPIEVETDDLEGTAISADANPNEDTEDDNLSEEEIAAKQKIAKLNKLIDFFKGVFLLSKTPEEETQLVKDFLSITSTEKDQESKNYLIKELICEVKLTKDSIEKLLSKKSDIPYEENNSRSPFMDVFQAIVTEYKEQKKPSELANPLYEALNHNYIHVISVYTKKLRAKKDSKDREGVPLSLFSNMNSKMIKGLIYEADLTESEIEALLESVSNEVTANKSKSSFTQIIKEISIEYESKKGLGEHSVNKTFEKNYLYVMNVFTKSLRMDSDKKKPQPQHCIFQSLSENIDSLTEGVFLSPEMAWKILENPESLKLLTARIADAPEHLTRQNYLPVIFEMASLSPDFDEKIGKVVNHIFSYHMNHENLKDLIFILDTLFYSRGTLSIRNKMGQFFPSGSGRATFRNKMYREIAKNLLASVEGDIASLSERLITLLNTQELHGALYPLCTTIIFLKTSENMTVKAKALNAIARSPLATKENKTMGTMGLPKQLKEAIDFQNWIGNSCYIITLLFKSNNEDIDINLKLIEKLKLLENFFYLKNSNGEKLFNMDKFHQIMKVVCDNIRLHEKNTPVDEKILSFFIEYIKEKNIEMNSLSPEQQQLLMYRWPKKFKDSINLYFAIDLSNVDSFSNIIEVTTTSEVAATLYDVCKSNILKPITEKINDIAGSNKEEQDQFFLSLSLIFNHLETSTLKTKKYQQRAILEIILDLQNKGKYAQIIPSLPVFLTAIFDNGSPWFFDISNNHSLEIGIRFFKLVLKNDYFSKLKEKRVSSRDKDKKELFKKNMLIFLADSWVLGNLESACYEALIDIFDLNLQELIELYSAIPDKIEHKRDIKEKIATLILLNADFYSAENRETHKEFFQTYSTELFDRVKLIDILNYFDESKTDDAKLLLWIDNLENVALFNKIWDKILGSDLSKDVFFATLSRIEKILVTVLSSSECYAKLDAIQQAILLKKPIFENESTIDVELDAYFKSVTHLPHRIPIELDEESFLYKAVFKWIENSDNTKDISLNILISLFNRLSEEDQEKVLLKRLEDVDRDKSLDQFIGFMQQESESRDQKSSSYIALVDYFKKPENAKNIEKISSDTTKKLKPLFDFLSADDRRKIIKLHQERLLALREVDEWLEYDESYETSGRVWSNNIQAIVNRCKPFYHMLFSVESASPDNQKKIKDTLKTLDEPAKDGKSAEDFYESLEADRCIQSKDKSSFDVSYDRVKVKSKQVKDEIQIQEAVLAKLTEIAKAEMLFSFDATIHSLNDDEWAFLSQDSKNNDEAVIHLKNFSRHRNNKHYEKISELKKSLKMWLEEDAKPTTTKANSGDNFIKHLYELFKKKGFLEFIESISVATGTYTFSTWLYQMKEKGKGKDPAASMLEFVNAWYAAEMVHLYNRTLPQLENYLKKQDEKYIETSIKIFEYNPETDEIKGNNAQNLLKKLRFLAKNMSDCFVGNCFGDSSEKFQAIINSYVSVIFCHAEHPQYLDLLNAFQDVLIAVSSNESNGITLATLLRNLNLPEFQKILCNSAITGRFLETAAHTCLALVRSNDDEGDFLVAQMDESSLKFGPTKSEKAFQAEHRARSEKIFRAFVDVSGIAVPSETPEQLKHRKELQNLIATDLISRENDHALVGETIDPETAQFVDKFIHNQLEQEKGDSPLETQEEFWKSLMGQSVLCKIVRNPAIVASWKDGKDVSEAAERFRSVIKLYRLFRQLEQSFYADTDREENVFRNEIITHLKRGKYQEALDCLNKEPIKGVSRKKIISEALLACFSTFESKIQSAGTSFSTEQKKEWKNPLEEENDAIYRAERRIEFHQSVTSDAQVSEIQQQLQTECDFLSKQEDPKSKAMARAIRGMLARYLNKELQEYSATSYDNKIVDLMGAFARKKGKKISSEEKQSIFAYLKKKLFQKASEESEPLFNLTQQQLFEKISAVIDSKEKGLAIYAKDTKGKLVRVATLSASAADNQFILNSDETWDDDLDPIDERLLKQNKLREKAIELCKAEAKLIIDPKTGRINHAKYATEDNESYQLYIAKKEEYDKLSDELRASEIASKASITLKNGTALFIKNKEDNDDVICVGCYAESNKETKDPTLNRNNIFGRTSTMMLLLDLPYHTDEEKEKAEISADICIRDVLDSGLLGEFYEQAENTPLSKDTTLFKPVLDPKVEVLATQEKIDTLIAQLNDEKKEYSLKLHDLGFLIDHADTDALLGVIEANILSSESRTASVGSDGLFNVSRILREMLSNKKHAENLANDEQKRLKLFEILTKMAFYFSKGTAEYFIDKEYPSDNAAIYIPQVFIAYRIYLENKKAGEMDPKVHALFTQWNLQHFPGDTTETTEDVKKFIKSLSKFTRKLWLLSAEKWPYVEKHWDAITQDFTPQDKQNILEVFFKTCLDSLYASERFEKFAEKFDFTLINNAMKAVFVEKPEDTEQQIALKAKLTNRFITMMEQKLHGYKNTAWKNDVTIVTSSKTYTDLVESYSCREKEATPEKITHYNAANISEKLDELENAFDACLTALFVEMKTDKLAQNFIDASRQIIEMRKVFSILINDSQLLPKEKAHIERLHDVLNAASELSKGNAFKWRGGLYKPVELTKKMTLLDDGILGIDYDKNLTKLKARPAKTHFENVLKHGFLLPVSQELTHLYGTTAYMEPIVFSCEPSHLNVIGVDNEYEVLASNLKGIHLEIVEEAKKEEFALNSEELTDKIKEIIEAINKDPKALEQLQQCLNDLEFIKKAKQTIKKTDFDSEEDFNLAVRELDSELFTIHMQSLFILFEYYFQTTVNACYDCLDSPVPEKQKVGTFLKDTLAELRKSIVAEGMKKAEAEDKSVTFDIESKIELIMVNSVLPEFCNSIEHTLAVALKESEQYDGSEFVREYNAGLAKLSEIDLSEVDAINYYRAQYKEMCLALAQKYSHEAHPQLGYAPDSFFLEAVRLQGTEKAKEENYRQYSISQARMREREILSESADKNTYVINPRIQSMAHLHQSVIDEIKDADGTPESRLLLHKTADKLAELLTPKEDSAPSHDLDVAVDKTKEKFLKVKIVKQLTDSTALWGKWYILNAGAVEQLVKHHETDDLIKILEANIKNATPDALNNAYRLLNAMLSDKIHAEVFVKDGKSRLNLFEWLKKMESCLGTRLIDGFINKEYPSESAAKYLPDLFIAYGVYVEDNKGTAGNKDEIRINNLLLQWNLNRFPGDEPEDKVSLFLKDIKTHIRVKLFYSPEKWLYIEKHGDAIKEDLSEQEKTRILQKFFTNSVDSLYCAEQFQWFVKNFGVDYNGKNLAEKVMLDLYKRSDCKEQCSRFITMIVQNQQLWSPEVLAIVLNEDGASAKLFDVDDFNEALEYYLSDIHEDKAQLKNLKEIISMAWKSKLSDTDRSKQVGLNPKRKPTGDFLSHEDVKTLSEEKQLSDLAFLDLSRSLQDQLAGLLKKPGFPQKVEVADVDLQKVTDIQAKRLIEIFTKCKNYEAAEDLIDKIITTSNNIQKLLAEDTGAGKKSFCEKIRENILKEKEIKDNFINGVYETKAALLAARVSRYKGVTFLRRFRAYWWEKSWTKEIQKHMDDTGVEQVSFDDLQKLKLKLENQSLTSVSGAPTDQSESVELPFKARRFTEIKHQDICVDVALNDLEQWQSNLNVRNFMREHNEEKKKLSHIDDLIIYRVQYKAMCLRLAQKYPAEKYPELNSVPERLVVEAVRLHAEALPEDKRKKAEEENYGQYAESHARMLEREILCQNRKMINEAIKPMANEHKNRIEPIIQDAEGRPKITEGTPQSRSLIRRILDKLDSHLNRTASDLPTSALVTRRKNQGSEASPVEAINDEDVAPKKARDEWGNWSKFTIFSRDSKSEEFLLQNSPIDSAGKVQMDAPSYRRKSFG